ncbi:hypothetical protein E1301_Tti022784 [Triplophysa tibetana]|uniref:Snake toxin/toxin-like domain-containing protein n=1 Tax=Triplophysa tibetana TaxID=1572043 RepID=A0A5A9PFQ9_9TELE|nr:hypothetical protein E1301_Tti022784 [Triplophysa tibetana]
MDLNIFMVLLLLFSGGHSLMCRECKKFMGSCEEKQVLCPSGAVCASTTTSLSILGNNAVNITTKGCALPESCGSLSINYGLSRTLVSVQCYFTSTRPNGKQCYYCDGTSCLNKLDCLGIEDRCITTIKTTKAHRKTLKGCASKSFCDAVPHINDRFINHVCCKGNLCNTENLRYMKKFLHLWDHEDNLWDNEDYL